MDNNDKISDTKSISLPFNNYFSSIGKELNNQIPRGHSNPLDYLHSPVKDSFFSFSLPHEGKLNFKYQKLASVVPVYKKGSQTSLSNYHPISLLSLQN